MILYTGANTTGPEVGHGQQVVRRLMEDYLGVGHTVYMDSFFSACGLFEALLQETTSACGTIVKNRKGLPKDITSKEWKLPKGIMLISTAHTAELKNTGKKDRRTNDDIKRPDVVDKYNQFMKGVDQMDQNLSYYSFNRKTLKWWKRMATHLIHLAKVQAYLLYKQQAAKALTQAQFTIKLIDQLMTESTVNRPAPTPAGDPLDATRLEFRAMDHWLECIPPTEKKLRPTKNCKCCTVHEKKPNNKNCYLRRKETRYQCSKCKVPLCVEPCMRIYHTHLDYHREIRRFYEAQ